MLARSFTSWIFFGGGVLVVILMLLFVCLASYTKRATAEGALIMGDGAVSLVSHASGRIKAVLAKEGQAVKKGDRLFIISNERILSAEVNNSMAHKMRSEIQSQISSLESEVRQVKLLQDQERIKRAAERQSSERDLKLVASQLKISESRLKLAEIRLLDFHQLNKTLIVSSQTVQEQADKVAALNTQIITFRRQYAEVEKALQMLTAEEMQAPVQTNLKLSNLERELSVRRQKMVEQNAQDEWVIVAPIDGELTSITAVEGQIALAQSLGVILPNNSKLSAQLYIDSKNIGFLKAGQLVRLRYDAFPYQKFGQYIGVVKDVTRNPIESNSLPPGFKSDLQKGKYRVSVDLVDQYINYKGQAIPLVSGMTLVADVELEERFLVEWLLDPLHSLRRIGIGE